MSLSTLTQKVQFTGNGATTLFAYNFYILDQTHIKVTETDTTTNIDTVKTLTTHYTVSGVGSAGGGNVTAVSAPSATKIWTIERVVPFTQLLALAGASSIPVIELVKALDKLMMAIQQLGATGGQVDRSIRYKATEPSGFTAEIPLTSDRLGKVLSFHSTTGVLQVSDANSLFSTQIASITASTASATASAAAASASSASAAISAAAAASAAAASSAMPLWLTATSYTAQVSVIRHSDEKIYRCATTHTSGTFATDLAAVKWVELSPTPSIAETVVTKTANYTVLTSDDGYTFNNTATSALVVLTLPSAPSVGFRIRAVVMDVDGIKLLCPASTTIAFYNLTSIAAGYAQSTTIGSTVDIQYMGSNAYVARYVLGSWDVQTS